MHTALRLMVLITGSVLPAAAFAQTPAAQAPSAPPAPAAVAPAALSGLRVAGFSPLRAYASSTEGKAGLARLAALESERKRAIEDRTKAIESQERSLQQNGAVLSPEARTQRTREIERYRVDVQRMIEDAQAELMGVQREIEAAFVVKLSPAVERVSKAKGLLLLFNLDAETIAWFDPSLDITSDIVRELAAQ